MSVLNLRPQPVWRRALAALAVLGLLSACGGGGSSDAPAAAPAPVVAAPPASRAEAARFLAQASFGPTEAEIDRVMALGFEGWIDAQLALPPSSHRTRFEALEAALRAEGGGAWQDQVLDVWWQHAVTAPDQLRQRWAYALSQIFVVSMAEDSVGDQPRAVAAWTDLLATEGLGHYRTLLEGVSRHPLMGSYLSHLKNQRADARTGRVPDENYAREVMQLFSIGLVPLNEDGRPREGAGETYGPDDISGLARVFTGWSWTCPDWPDTGCFRWGHAEGVSDPDRAFKPMLGYPQFHSAEEKRFLGTTIAAQDLPDPQASLRVALDTLAAHPNVGPFIGRQLIQRLVSSNPSPEHVRHVARVWADNGAGVRGDLRAVLKAVLLHPDARRAPAGDHAGKLREPVLRLTAVLRAFGYRSDSGRWRVGSTDNPATSLGQSPLRAPSVFNFYRPGYMAPGSRSAAAGLVAPELQLAHETTAPGYVNFMRDSLAQGVGQWNGRIGDTAFNRRDLQGDFSAELALAGEPAALVARVADKLIHAAAGTASAALQAEVTAAVATIAIPVLNSSGSNQAAIDSARRHRVQAAVLLLLVAPEFIVQR